jgi:hypothetical protein
MKKETQIKRNVQQLVEGKLGKKHPRLSKGIKKATDKALNRPSMMERNRIR